jgi:glycosyltransferase involved in cell wall biosynthesis
VSERDRRHFESRARLVLEVPNGIDDEFFQISTALPETEDLLFFGHFDYPPNELGVMRFLREGWPRLASVRPNARLLLAGRGVSATLARALASAERVVVLGFVPDLVSLLGRSRLILVPIWHGGGTRLKVLESLASARPIVGTVSGVEETGFVHGRHGLIADDPVELADQAAGLLADRGRSESLAGAGRELAQRYRWPQVLEPAEQLYSTWLGAADQA